MITISKLQLVPVRFENGLTFFADFVLDERYFVGNVAIYTLRDGSGFRVVYPTKKLRNGQQVPIFYPTDKTIANEIQQMISDEATKLLLPTEQTKTRYAFGIGDPDF